MSFSGNKVSFEDKDLQTEFDYVIDVYVNEPVNEPIVFSFEVLNIDGSISDNFELSYQLNEKGDDIAIEFSLLRLNSLLEREQAKTLHLKSSALAIDKKFEIIVWDTPKVSELNLPQLAGLISDSTLEVLGNQSGVYFYWLNLPAWHPSEELTWREDPFDNVSWKLFFHSLGWLNSYAELYERTGNESYFSAIEKYLSQYDEITDNPFDSPISVAYKEDAVSLRVNNLAYLYLKFYIHKPKEQRSVIESLLNKDILMLQKYLEETKWDNKNHGLIQARAALNVIVTLPLNEDVELLFDSVNRRLSALSEQLFSSQGYVIEQATEYHFVSLSMMLEAKQQLVSFNMPANLELNQKIRKALIVAPYLLHQDGTTPAIGDSSYGKKWRGYITRFYREFDEPIPEVDLYLSQGQSALDDLLVLGEEGLVVAKHTSSTQEMSKAFFDVGKAPIIHGHYDNLNIVASLAGEKVLVDSGGPYTYEKKDREHFWKSSAHNLLVLNGEEKPEQSAEIIHYHENELQIEAKGEISLGNNVMHQRGFILTKEPQPVLIIVDQISNIDASDKVDEYWHYSPDLVAEKLDNQITQLPSSSGRTFFQYRLTGHLGNCQFLTGLYEDNRPSLGWVSPTYNKITPATVQHCLNNGNDDLIVNVFTEQKFETTPNYLMKENQIIINLEGRDIIYNLH